MEFYNREKELRDLLNMINQDPNLITFIYGPINSGKTVLMYHLVNEILPKQEEKYATFYINLRGYSITKQEEFLKVLFEVCDEDSFKKKFDGILKGLEKYHKAIPVIRRIWREFFYGEKSFDAFKHVEDFLQELNDKGLKPIIIFDELQVIKDIKINELLIYRVFNLFIRLTKELKLCHVFAITSDSTFIEKIYNEAMLQDRAKYYLVDDFDREIVENLLRDKGFSDEEINLVWNYFGGKPIYLVEAIQSKNMGKNIKEEVERMLKLREVQIRDRIEVLKFVEKHVRIEGKEIVVDRNRLLNLLSRFKHEEIIPYEGISPELLYLIENNILFLDPVNNIVKPQSKLNLLAIRNLLKEFNI